MSWSELNETIRIIIVVVIGGLGVVALLSWNRKYKASMLDPIDPEHRIVRGSLVLPGLALKHRVIRPDELAVSATEIELSGMGAVPLRAAKTNTRLALIPDPRSESVRLEVVIDDRHARLGFVANYRNELTQALDQFGWPYEWQSEPN